MTLSFLLTQISFFKKGIELVSKKMDNFLSSVSTMTQRLTAVINTNTDIDQKMISKPRLKSSTSL